jgi:hypothetical protein
MLLISPASDMLCQERREELTISFEVGSPGVAGWRPLARILVLLLAVWAGSMTTGAADAQTPSVDELDAAAAKASTFLTKIRQQLLVYDRVLEMKVARGALTPEQATNQLLQRAEDLAKGTVTAKAQEDEEQQEAKLFFDAIDQAANGSPHWPALQSPAYYHALVGAILTRVRAEYADRLTAHLSTAQALDDAYRALALTRGQEHLEATPFSSPDSRVFARHWSSFSQAARHCSGSGAGMSKFR